MEKEKVVENLLECIDTLSELIESQSIRIANLDWDTVNDVSSLDFEQDKLGSLTGSLDTVTYAYECIIDKMED